MAIPRQRGDQAFTAAAKEKRQGLASGGSARDTSQENTKLAAQLPNTGANQKKIPTELAAYRKAGSPAGNPENKSPIQAVSTGTRLLITDQEPERPGPIGLNPQSAAELDLPAVPADGPSSETAGASESGEEGADEEEEEAEEEAETLFRPELHEWGPIVVESIYTGEVFNNTRGGISTQNATRYRGNLDLTFSLDFEKAKLWSGGELFVYFHQSHGTTLTPDFVGDGQYYSNIDTGPRPQQLSRLGEYWYRHTSPDEAMAIKIGRQDANADFAFCDLSGDFLNSSFVTIPNIPMPFWPFQTLGVSGVNQVNDQLKLGGGIYDQSHNMDQWWTTSSDQGVFAICQADWTPFAAIEDAKLTLIRWGGWYTTADTEAIEQTNLFPDNYGLYTTVDRMLFTERNAADQGLGGFFQFSWAPDDRNQVDRAFGAGLIYRGLLSNRDQDTCGIAYTGIMFSDLLRAETGQTSEDVMELFYKARLRKGISIQPDLQYIARPYGQERDALVAGLRFESNF